MLTLNGEVRWSRRVSCAIVALCFCGAFAAGAQAGSITGEVVDAETGKALPCRVYIQGADGAWRFPSSVGGSAVRYEVKRFERCIEYHTTLSAHPFRIELEPGEYSISVERGKEYFPETRTVTVGAGASTVSIPMRRWVDMAARGWYSGDTHVHRTLEDLPNVMLAEDLNVAFPLLSWVREGFRVSPAPPVDSPALKKVIRVDGGHVICPRNTEYEIFSIDGKSHTLGALFILNHKTPLRQGVPPVGPMVEQARAEGALLELDKHNWPWSMALPPLTGVDLFELSNNHVWRTEFGFSNFGEREAPYMDVERDEKGFTERGWLEFGFQNYYALLNCGFPMRPTAGTASGVHPVPLGFGRVYVHLDGAFDLDSWLEGLDAGRSFVTTGPMLFATLNGKMPGQVFESARARSLRLEVDIMSEHPIERVELVSNGEVKKLPHSEVKTKAGAYIGKSRATLSVDSTSWVAVRCFEKRPDGRARFAHGAPFHIEVEDRPLRPRRVEVEYLAERVRKQIERSRQVLPEAAIAEYRKALDHYKILLKTAR